MLSWVILIIGVVAALFFTLLGIGYWLLGRYLDDIEKRDAEEC